MEKFLFSEYQYSTCSFPNQLFQIILKELISQKSVLILYRSYLALHSERKSNMFDPNNWNVISVCLWPKWCPWCDHRRKFPLKYSKSVIRIVNCFSFLWIVHRGQSVSTCANYSTGENVSSQPGMHMRQNSQIGRKWDWVTSTGKKKKVLFPLYYMSLVVWLVFSIWG